MGEEGTVRTLISTLVVLGFGGLAGFVLWWLAIRPRLPLRDRIAGLLQLVAVYTLLQGLLSSSGVFKVFGILQQGLTSPDPLIFLRANFWMFAGVFFALGLSLHPDTVATPLRMLLGVPVLVGLSLIVMAYALVHFLAIVPIAYFAYVVTSVPVDAILNATSDVEITIGGAAVRIQGLVAQNEAAIRNFVVALPAFTVSLVLKMWPMVRRGAPATK
jgi:hypothetical protein